MQRLFTSVLGGLLWPPACCSFKPPALLALKDPAILAKPKDLGGTSIPGSPADFGKLVADETARWEKVVRAANLSIN